VGDPVEETRMKILGPAVTLLCIALLLLVPTAVWATHDGT
jgi:hypothetical protein